MLNLKNRALHHQPTALAGFRLTMAVITLALLSGCVTIHLLRPVPMNQLPQVARSQQPDIALPPSVITEQRLPMTSTAPSLHTIWIRYNQSDQHWAATCFQSPNHQPDTSPQMHSASRSRCWAALHTHILQQEWRLSRRNAPHTMRRYYHDLAHLASRCRWQGTACLSGKWAAITQQGKRRVLRIWISGNW